MTAELPPDVVVAAGRAIELLSRVLKEGGRSDEEQLEFATAIIDIAIAIDPEERKKLEPFVPDGSSRLARNRSGSLDGTRRGFDPRGASRADRPSR